MFFFSFFRMELLIVRVLLLSAERTYENKSKIIINVLLYLFKLVFDFGIRDFNSVGNWQMREFCAIIKEIKSHLQTSFFDGRTNKDGYYSCATRKHECHIFMIYIAFSMNSRMSGATAQNKRRKKRIKTHHSESFGALQMFLWQI